MKTLEETAKEKSNGLINLFITNCRECGGKEIAVDMALRSAIITRNEINSIPKYASCAKFEFKKKLWETIVTILENENT